MNESSGGEVHDVDLNQVKKALGTLKDVSLLKIEEKYGMTGGAAASAFIGMAEYISARLLPQFNVSASAGVNKNQVTDIEVQDPNLTPANNDSSTEDDHTASNDELIKSANEHHDELKA